MQQHRRIGCGKRFYFTITEAKTKYFSAIFISNTPRFGQRSRPAVGATKLVNAANIELYYGWISIPYSELKFIVFAVSSDGFLRQAVRLPLQIEQSHQKTEHQPMQKAWKEKQIIFLHLAIQTNQLPVMLSGCAFNQSHLSRCLAIKL